MRTTTRPQAHVRYKGDVCDLPDQMVVDPGPEAVLPPGGDQTRLQTAVAAAGLEAVIGPRRLIPGYAGAEGHRVVCTNPAAYEAFRAKCRGGLVTDSNNRPWIRSSHVEWAIRALQEFR